jgi:hypothetical protein
MSASTGSAPPETASDAVVIWRGLLIGGGVLLLLIGGATFLTDVPASRYPAIAAWLAGAIVLHDGVGAMLVFAVSVLLRRLEPRIPFIVIAIVQAAAVVAVIVTVIVLPEIVKKAIGTANPTILPLDYLAHLVWFYAGVGVVTAVSISVALAFVTRAPRPPRRTR